MKMEFDENQDVCPTDDMYSILKFTCYGMLAIYLLVCIPLVHNIVKYVIRQQRYKTFLVSVFYSHAVVHIAFRLLTFALQGV